MNQLEKLSLPVCPACGFRIFTRRYPKCESCGAVLPEALVYSASEIAALREGEALEESIKLTKKKTTPTIVDGQVDFGMYGGAVSSSDGGTGCGGDGGGCS